MSDEGSKVPKVVVIVFQMMSRSSHVKIVILNVQLLLSLKQSTFIIL